MRKKFIIVLSFLLLIPCWELSAENSQRIVSLKPNITDIIAALGAGDRLVGITRYCDPPPGKTKPQVVADYTQISIEKIVALSPDLVIGSMENSSRRSIESLSRMGITVKLFPFTTLEETLQSMREIGAFIGSPEKGATLASQMEQKLGALKKKWGEEKPPLTTMIVWGVKPLIVAGKGTYMDELLEFIGAKNVVTSGGVQYPRIGIEEMIALDPDVIVDLAMGSESNGAASRPWNEIKLMKAVAKNRVIRMDTSQFRAGPHLPDALEELAAKMHVRDRK